MSSTFLVTGANSGLGLDAVRKLAQKTTTKLVYVACRSESKALAAMDLLFADGILRTKLAFVKFDAGADYNSIKQSLTAIVNVPLDGVILNAGGIGADKKGVASGPNHVVAMHQINLIAHVQMIEIFKASKLLNRGCRIVFSGSEAARGVPMMMIGSPKMGNNTSWYEDELAGRHSFNPLKSYAVSKGIAALYFAEWARRNPEYVVLVVSPGGTSGTEAMKAKAVPGHFKVLMPAMMPLMQSIGVMHSLDKGSERYVDAVLGTNVVKRYASGTFLASAHGTTGKMEDQTKLRAGRKYADKKKQSVVYQVVSKYSKPTSLEKEITV